MTQAKAGLELESKTGRYLQLLRFLLPLALTIIVQEFGMQFLNGGMARAPQATETLAGFGLAWGLVSLVIAALNQTRQLGLVLVDGRQSFGMTQLFVVITGLFLSAILAGLALSPLGVWVVEELHQIEQPLSGIALETLFWFIPAPFLWGLSRFYSGLLIRLRRTDVVSFAIIASIGASILSVFVLLPTDLVQVKPIWLPILVTYIGILVELGIILWGCKTYTAQALNSTNDKLSLIYIFQFFWPLAFIMAIQGMSRPLINLFVSRGPNGAEALAILTIAYGLGHLPYGWLNEIRNLPSAFRDVNHSLFYIRRFAAWCGLFSFGLMVSLFWTPVRVYLLETLIGLDSKLAAQAVIPLVIFSFFPLAVTIRAYLHGVGLLERRTKAMAPSGPSRIGAILVMLLVLPFFGFQGATLGVAALFSGFVGETLIVWWGIRGRTSLHKFTALPLF